MEEACPKSQKSSHIGIGMAIGAIIGVAAGLFAQSKKGKELQGEVETKMKEIQGEVMQKLGEVEHVTKAKYEEVVDHVMAYYVKTKEVAETEVPMVRDYFMNRWEAIQEYLKKD